MITSKINMAMFEEEPISHDEFDKAVEAIGLLVYSEEAIAKFDADVAKYVEKGSTSALTSEEYDWLQKAVRDRSHLVKKIVTRKDGRKTTKWVRPADAGKSEGGKKAEDGGDSKTGKKPEEHAAGTDTKKLEDYAKNGKDEDLKKIAQEELKKREAHLKLAESAKKDENKSKNDKSVSEFKDMLGEKDADIKIKTNSSGDRIVSVNGQTAFNADDKGRTTESMTTALKRAYKASVSLKTDGKSESLMKPKSVKPSTAAKAGAKLDIDKYSNVLDTILDSAEYDMYSEFADGFNMSEEDFNKNLKSVKDLASAQNLKSMNDEQMSFLKMVSEYEHNSWEDASMEWHNLDREDQREMEKDLRTLGRMVTILGGNKTEKGYDPDLQKAFGTLGVVSSITPDLVKADEAFDITVSTDFTAIVTSLFNIQNKLEHCHRLTKSDPRHDAIGSAYHQVSYLKDSIIEHIIGYSGDTYKSLFLSPIGEYTPTMPVETADEIIALSDGVANFAKANKYHSIENLAQELSGVAAKLKYKLGFNNSDEGSLSKAFETLGISKAQTATSPLVVEDVEKGCSLPDGTFSIKTKEDLDNAIHAVDLASDIKLAKSHIRTRATALGLVSNLPKDWN